MELGQDGIVRLDTLGGLATTVKLANGAYSKLY